PRRPGATRRANGRANCRRSLLPDLLAQPAVMLHRLARAEVLQLEELADLDFAILSMGIGAALDPFDRFRQRLALQCPVAGHELLGLREWAIDDGALAARQPHPHPLSPPLH